MNAAVFLDRDNTIIHNDGDLGDPELVRLIQGAASAVASLRGLNYKIIVVTNQGGVARGKYGEADVEKTNQRVADLIKAASGANIDRFYYCPYHPQGSVPEYTCEHDWRKPQPGMLLQAAKDMNIDLSQSWMVGDQMRDVQAGIAAGTRCILLRADAQELQPLRGDQLKSGQIETTGDLTHFSARSMIEAVRIIAKQRKPEAEQSAEPTRRKWDPEAVKSARQSSTSEASAAPTPPSQPSQDFAVPVTHDQTTHTPESQLPAAVSPVASPAPPLSGKSVRMTPPKPFKPWGASGEGARETHVPSKVQPPHQTTKQASKQTPTPVSAAIETTPAPAPDVTDPSLEPHEVAAMVAQDEWSSDVAVSASFAAGQADASVTSDVPQQAEDRRRPPSSDVTLRQILQELRGQRTVQNDFSYVRMIAVVLQIVAVFLLVAGLLLGASDVEIFLRWIATAMLVQLAAIALLLLER